MENFYKAPGGFIPVDRPEIQFKEVYIASNQIEALALADWLKSEEIHCHIVTLGVTNSLAMSALPDDQFSIRVPSNLVEKAQAIARQFDKRQDERNDQDLEDDLAVDPQKEMARRKKYMAIFLIPLLLPITTLIALVNAIEYRKLAQQLGESTTFASIGLTLGWIQLVAFLVWFFKFIA